MFDKNYPHDDRTRDNPENRFSTDKVAIFFIWCCLIELSGKELYRI